MPTTVGFRKFSQKCSFFITNTNFRSRFFPSTEPDAESDWEEVEGGESAENGPAAQEGEAKGTEVKGSKEEEDDSKDQQYDEDALKIML